jgi:hypothetical protein
MAQDFAMPLKGLTNSWNSIWVFTLIAMEAVKTYRTNPNFMIGTTAIPTWITPFVLVLCVSALVPNTSFLGHLCGLAFGYGCMLSPHCPGWTSKLTDYVRGPRILEIPCTTRMDS